MSDIAALVADNLDIWTGAIERKNGAGRAKGAGGGKRISLYGIERLRALILDLAVRGKLVPQDAGDEPASELLKKFKSQKTAWISEKRIKKGKPLERMTKDEFSFTPPNGWEWTRFGELGDWGAGATPNRKTSSYYGGETPWFKSGELVGDYISLSEETVTELALRECSLRLNAPGDVLIAMYGATIGKTSILEVEATTNQAVCACTPFDGLFNRYLLLLLKAMRAIFVGQGAGGAQPNISREKIIATPLCLPPLAEQHRIVAKVDELMALCDALERESADALAAHQTLVETLLATLVQSADAADLATNWARLESHFDTLFTTEASIDALKQTILDLAVRGKFNGNSVGWPLKPLGDYVVDAAAGWSPRCLETPRSDENWGVLKVSAVTWGRFQPEENKELPSKLEPRPEIEVKPGDFLISRANTADLVARSVIVPEDAPSHLMMSDKIIRFRFKNELDPQYVNLVNASPFARSYYLNVAGGTSSSMKNVSQSQIRALEIPIPPLAEQRRIVAKVDEFMALCDTLKSRIAGAVETRRHLADAITQRAAA